VGSVTYLNVDNRMAGPPAQVGTDITSVALSPDFSVLAAVDRGGGTVTLLDAETEQVRSTVAVGSHPRACVWDSANPRWLYVAVEDDGVVAVVDRFLGTVADRIAVGRLPSGLAVSATRRELYVAHRIDADLAVVDLRDRTVAADVPLADEPYSAATTPNGKPFAFEAPTVTPDGRYAWMPHELLAPTHPFVFNETLFPAISVVDLIARAEAQTNPNMSNVAGRKNLFDAINVLGPDGQPEVFSQICAVALHPNGNIGWALACGSEDLLVFDVNAGTATDALRNLPVDHPVALTLDDTGQRVFVLGDQSHQVLTFDTANGSLIGHTEMYGEPIATLDGMDTVDPTLRAGLKVFFRANTAKGSPTTTSKNWMSCAGCHLDGFTSTNQKLFEALVPPDPARHALIGHEGLADHFATVVPGGPDGPLDPHDLLVAVGEQGGLADGDAGTVDPSDASQNARAMAQQLAAVVARDLPHQPTWEQPQGVPNPAWDAAYCGSAKCHPTEYAAWSASVHAHASVDTMVTFCSDQVEPQFKALCQGCHDPIVARGTLQPEFHGVTCLGCHDVERALRAGGNGDLVTVAHADWSGDHKARALASLDTLRDPRFCAGCHQQFVPGNGMSAITTYAEYAAGPYAAGGTRCIECHMQRDGNGVADHRFPGGNVYLGQVIGDATLVQEQTRNLSAAVKLQATRLVGAGGVQIVVTNVGVGHSFPTGVTDLREPWVEVDVAGDAGTPPYGGPASPCDLLPPGAARLGMDIAGADGGLLLRHELSLAERIPFDVTVPPLGAQAFFVPVDAHWATKDLVARLYFRNVRTTYYRAAMADGGTGTGNDCSAPSILVAETQVQDP
jgi:DNA-binding beta-propeller fold protein YncE